MKGKGKGSEKKTKRLGLSKMIDLSKKISARAIRGTRKRVPAPVDAPAARKKETARVTAPILPVLPVAERASSSDGQPVAAISALPRPSTMDYELPPLQQRYHDDRLALLVRDPWWVFLYWDISPRRVSEVVGTIPQQEQDGMKWILRVYDVTDAGGSLDSAVWRDYFDQDIYYDASSWYVNVNKPGRVFCVEIGFKSKSGAFYAVARSNFSKTPAFGISSKTDEEWGLPDDEYFKILGVYEMGRSSMERAKRVEKVLREQISSGAFSPGMSSMFSRMEQAKKRKFFLEVWTELILYGRTEPDASVEVLGKPVRLRPDGTFSIRYALPEGDFEYPVAGTSSDKVDTIVITPAVKRFTKGT